MSDSFSTELLREMQDAFIEANDEDKDDSLDFENGVQYTIIIGLKSNSKVMWAYNEKNIYYKNSYSNKTKETAYTCKEPNCRVRVFLREDGTAYRDFSEEHEHSSHFEIFKQMYCENKLKEKARTAPASMTPNEIFKQVVVE